MTDTTNNTTTTTNNTNNFPGNWRIAADFDPNQHLMSLKGRDYLNVQNRLLWFVRDQRELIIRGLATTSYVIRTELVEQDRESGYAHFKTFVRDVLGNEATMYGSESVKDFGDYAEKASTKSLGRALLALGYGTGFAPEMDESDERPVDTPVERKRPAPATPAVSLAPVPGVWPQVPPQSQPQPTAAAMTTTVTAPKVAKRMATPEQWTALRNLCAKVGAQEPEPGALTYERAGALIAEYSETYKRLVAQRQRQGANNHATALGTGTEGRH